MSWFKETGWRYDSRNHCWIQDDISNIVEIGEKELPKRETVLYGEASHGINFGTSIPNSKPFSRINNILIFNSSQFPLKWHEVMFKP